MLILNLKIASIQMFLQLFGITLNRLNNFLLKGIGVQR